MLFVSINLARSGGGDPGTSPNYVRFNGVDMTKLATVYSTYGARAFVYYMVAPPVGTYNITLYGSIADNGHYVAAASLINVHQTGIPDATYTTGAYGGTCNLSLSTVKNHCFVFGTYAWKSAGVPTNITLGTNESLVSGGAGAWYDSAGLGTIISRRTDAPLTGYAPSSTVAMSSSYIYGSGTYYAGIEVSLQTAIPPILFVSVYDYMTTTDNRNQVLPILYIYKDEQIFISEDPFDTM